MAALLNGRRAVVTGGTRGVGRATTLALLRAGATVVAAYRDDSSSAGAMPGLHGWDDDRAHLVRADLGTSQGRDALVAEVGQHLGGVDILVNNLGTYEPAPLETVPESVLVDSLHVNLTTHVLVSRALLPLLSDRASIVTIGAAMAERGRPAHTAFTTAKAGLAGFTRALAKELAPRHIRVNAVAPGVVETERGLDLPPPVRAALLAAIPLGRFVNAGDVAATVLFLASDQAELVSGATIKVDGGI